MLFRTIPIDSVSNSLHGRELLVNVASWRAQTSTEAQRKTVAAPIWTGLYPECNCICKNFRKRKPMVQNEAARKIQRLFLRGTARQRRLANHLQLAVRFNEKIIKQCQWNIDCATNKQQILKGKRPPMKQLSKRCLGGFGGVYGGSKGYLPYKGLQTHVDWPCAWSLLFLVGLPL